MNKENTHFLASNLSSKQLNPDFVFETPSLTIKKK